MHATTSIIGADHAQQLARNESGNEPAGSRVRSSEFCSDLRNVARATISEEIERSDLCQREVGRRELLRGGEDELTPKPANGDDAATDLTETLTSTRYFVDPATERCSPRACDTTAQLIRSTGEVW